MPHCQTFLSLLRQRGYRITPQREMIIEALAHSGQHITAEEIFDIIRARTQAVNIATVYRTLDVLVEKGLASRADLGDGRVVYATAYHGAHIHLICRQCGCIIDASAQLMISAGESFLAQHGFAADLRHLSIHGLCADCQTNT
jgi:Fur family ferric uptake transcriptional regulator